ncbi:MAG: response regulator transcription factor [Nostocoides sp.]
MTLRVLLVDDHAMLREAVAGAMATTPDLEVVAQSASIREARDALLGTRIHAAVIDISLPDGNGLTLVRRMRAASPTVGIVVLTMHDDERTLEAAQESGASALVLKQGSAVDVIDAVRQSVRHPGVFVAPAIRARQPEDPDAADKLVHLTAREQEVLRLLAAGSSIATVAAKLYMSESTVKTHTARLYGKLEAHNRAAAIMAAVRLGLVDPDPAHEVSAP